MFKLFKKKKEQKLLEEQKMGLIFGVLIAVARILNVPTDLVKEKMKDVDGMEKYARELLQ